ncbi:MAG: choice-of-anchor Q domain-containing protein, partial [Anaerolineales bacterium]|nr:choice-of-anchor Q domain-containing protein [Anaerolineales bacterium]
EDALVHGNTLTGGKASNGGFAMGGGIMTDSANLYTDRVQISRNAAISGAAYTSDGVSGQPGGGGAYLTSFSGTPGCTARLVNTIVSDNQVTIGSPGMLTGGAGAGLTIQAITADILHSTLAGNQLGSGLVLGGAISIQGLYGESGAPAIVNVEYSIIANHVNTETNYTAAVSVMRNSSLAFNNGIFSGNTNDTNANSIPILPGTITGLNTMTQVDDLRFVSPGPPDYDYHLQNSSPAIDQATSGSIPVDIDGEIRPFSTYPDIGADEYNQPTMVASPQSFLALADGAQVLTTSFLLQVNSGTQVAWSAETSENWLFLGTDGTAHQAQGAPGESLLVWIKPEFAPLGTHLGTITITGENVNPTLLEITLLKVEKVQTTSLPLILR